MAEVSVQRSGAVFSIVGRETKHDQKNDRMRKWKQRSHDVQQEWYPICPPRYDFEYSPKYGEEGMYRVFNLEYDAHNNPGFLWPLQRYITPGKHIFIPVHKLLFHPPRNFLVNNSGHKFDAAHLDGKMLVILILSLHPKEEKEGEKIKHFTGALREAYTELRSRGIGFEVVFVAVGDSPGGGTSQDQQYFDALFKDMPWLAIPWWNKKARKKCEDSLYHRPVYGPIHCFLLQTNGFILHDCPEIFTIYGEKAFPFTSQRLEELEYQNLRFFKDPSIKELLGDFVISPQGDRVPTAHLEKKVVGLFFACNSIITTMLLSAWETLKARHSKDFEIVLVREPYSTYSPGDSYCSFPWSSLSDTSLCQKLWWIYHPPTGLAFWCEREQHPGILVVIDPQNHFFNYYGADTLYRFQAEGYPFTMERAAELEREKQKKLELRSLLGEEDLIRAADGKKVNLSELLGKEVVLLVSTSSRHKEREVMLEKLEVTLKRWKGFPVKYIPPPSRYIPPHARAMNEDLGGKFPIIYISADGAIDEDRNATDRVMICPSMSAYSSCVSSGLVGHHDPPSQIAVFGRDGRLAAKLCWRDAGGGKRTEMFQSICDMSLELFYSQVHHMYSFKDLVGWDLLEGDRKLMDVDYI